MTSPRDTAVTNAVRRGDAAWLGAYFDGMTCPVGVLRTLVRHQEPVLRHLGFVLLRDRVTRHPDADVLPLLPAEMPEEPETALVLADVLARLRALAPVGRRPAWRAGHRPARVRIAWLRAELVAGIVDEPAGEELYQAVALVGAADVHDVEAYARALIARHDPVLREAASRIVRDGVHAALIAPTPAYRILLAVADAGERTAHDALREPWAHVVATAATADVAAGRRDAGDPELSGAVRRTAMAALGDIARREDVADLVRLAAVDPLLLAGPAVEALGAMHRRGHFAGPESAAAVVGLGLAEHTVAAEEIAIVLFTARRAALAALLDAADDDALWPRRIEIALALHAQGAPDPETGQALTDRLTRVARPEPMLAALRRLRHAAAENAVIAMLPRAPAAALDTLAAIGGRATVNALNAGIGEPGGVVVPHLRGVLARALEVLWHLTEDHADRAALLARLDPRELPADVAADLGRPDHRELAALASHLDPDDPVDALCRVARGAAGDAETSAVLTDLLHRVVADIADAAPTRDDAAAPTVPDEVTDALRALGRDLYARRALRPVCLLDAADPDTAGDRLLAHMALDILDRPDIADAEAVILLELLTRVPGPSVRARVHRMLRHRDPHVRKHVIALLACDAGHDARALSASLIPLTASPDPGTVRQAVRALGRARAHWAGDAIAAVLEHPVMNVRKTAARALRDAGTARQVPAQLAWVGRHDNPGLRDELVAALRAILGDGYTATVLAEAERIDDDRARARLVATLGTDLSDEAVTALRARGSRVARCWRVRGPPRSPRPRSTTSGPAWSRSPIRHGPWPPPRPRPSSTWPPGTPPRR